MMAYLALPEVVLGITALLILLIDSFMRDSYRRLAGWTAVIMVAAIIAYRILPLGGSITGIFAADLTHGPSGLLFLLIAALASLGTLILVLDWFRDDSAAVSRLSALIIFSLLGITVLMGARNMLVLYLGLELMTFPIYLAIASGRGAERSHSLEAAVKYFLMGSVASATFLFGVSLIYASWGTIGISDFNVLMLQGVPPIAIIGFTLMGVAVFFKLSAFPLHFWTPDAYEGAPIPITAYMATAVKTAAIVFLLKTLGPLCFAKPFVWVSVIAVLSVCTMTWGNWVALHQRVLSRLFAYSSIAHVGYMLIAVSLLSYGAGGWQGPITSLILYLVSYVAMTLGAFAVLCACRVRTLDDAKGLSRRAPFAAAMLTLFLISLIGIPPTAGFMGKFYIFLDALKEGRVGLAIAGGLNSALAAFYYLKIIRAVYMEEGENQTPVHVNWAPRLVILACAATVLWIGLNPASHSFIADLALSHSH